MPASVPHSYVGPSMGELPILPLQAGAQDCQPSDILFKFWQLIFAVHLHHEFKQIRCLAQFSYLFITLDQHEASAAGPQLITRSLCNGLAGLTARDGVVLALPGRKSAPEHAPGL